jgi:hypothetical protein
MPGEARVLARRQSRHKWGVRLLYAFLMIEVPARRAWSFSLWSYRPGGVLRTPWGTPDPAILAVPPVAARQPSHG